MRPLKDYFLLNDKVIRELYMKTKLYTRIDPKDSPFTFYLDSYTGSIFDTLCKYNFKGNKSQAVRAIIKQFTECTTGGELTEWAKLHDLAIARIFDYALLTYDVKKYN